jgi:futalosine hydrolase
MNRKGKTLIGLISAVPFEGDLLAAKCGKGGRRQTANLVFHAGIEGRTRFICAASGIGKTNAAHAAVIMIEKYSPSMIVNFGIGGAYPSSGLEIGAIAVAEKEVHVDEGVFLKDGFHTLETMGIPTAMSGRRRYFNEFPADRLLGRKALKAASCVANAASGRFATASSSSGTKKRGLEIERRFNVICENMEGAAVAQICCIRGIPFVEMRGISNMVEDRDTGKWDMKLAAERCQIALIYFLERLKG